ncbi:MAG: hypothetical protein HPY71_06855 [Firmicutes bacterium]|nr:hypothetical protein [Bacillota bacterium]
MSDDERQVVSAKKDVVSEIRQACFHFADLYFHFSRVLIDELGYEKGRALIEKAVRNRAVERGERLRKRAIEQNLPLTLETWAKITDIPFRGWDKSLGRMCCPYATAWLPRFEENPWFREIAELYCNVNDPQVTETFTGNTSQRITRNVLRGDETCEREYFPAPGSCSGQQAHSQGKP